MKTDLVGLLAVACTLVASACGGGIGVELGRVGPGAAGAGAIADGGTGGFTQVPDAGTGEDPNTERLAAGSGGSAGGGVGGAAGSSPSLCDQILIDNTAPNPPAYPSIYQPPTDALAKAQEQVATFLAHYGMTAEQLQIDLAPVTATAEIPRKMNDTGVPLSEPPGKIESSDFESEARNFLLQWDGLFKSSGLTWAVNDENGCYQWGRCSMVLSQDYCGFGVSSDGVYKGTVQLDATQETGLIGVIWNNLVPMISVYSKAVYTKEQVAASLVGSTYVLCSDESCLPHKVEDQKQLEVQSALQVVVRRPDGKDYLEYRLAYKVFVPNRLYEFLVDAIDGKVIYGMALAIG